MPRMDLNLSPQMTSLIERLVADGEYQSASAVVQEALERLQRMREADQEKLEALRAAIDVGWRQAERGEHAELDIDAAARSVLKRDAA